ncbi:MAG: glycosyltransferase family 2 protein [Acidimicrobiaceae bacterium]|nr:glycosyltransferase family 2 protein [Acidimicrobiaceae bacterium]
MPLEFDDNIPIKYGVMLTFITTIRHPRNSTSYLRVGQLLEATLRSVCRQSDEDFQVVVVHNEKPDISFTSAAVSYVQVDFPPPVQDRTPTFELGPFRVDKGTKCAVGIIAARELGAQHVMFIDADDYLHCGLAGLANGNPEHPGWYSPQGFVHTAGSRYVQPVEAEFHRKNGSTSIIRADLTGVPEDLRIDAAQAEIIASMPDGHVERLFGAHGKWQDHLSVSGLTMEAMPFPCAIWEIGTGENHSGNLVSKRKRQMIDPAITDTFGLKKPSHISSLWSSARVQTRRIQQHRAAFGKVSPE